MNTVQGAVKNFNLSVKLLYNEPLESYTTFRVGGPAEVLALPGDTTELRDLLKCAAAADIPVTVLGGGANVVISDRGIPGLVIHTGRLNRITRQGEQLRAEAGLPVSTASAFAADHDLEGLDFIYAMPGSVGGAVWMNARCYDGEIAGILDSVEYVTMAGDERTYRANPADFSYKISPFQDGSRLIVAATFNLLLRPGAGKDLWQRMRSIEDDRRRKGHFEAPCAGSVFKNDRTIGEPSGKIIDSLGLRGLRRGGARVSPHHGNIIINTGTATAGDIRGLVTEVRDTVYRETGFVLEPEILFLGNWN
jgi:UDP-N-acetylmuramate dehydrogenase